MKFLAAALLLAGIALFVWTATHQLPGIAPAGAGTQEGFKPYKKHCARCHGLGGRSERAAQMAEKPVSLVDAHWKNTVTRAQLRRVIVEGEGDMEAIDPEVLGSEIETIIDFVLWLPADTFNPDTESVSP